MMAIQPKVSCNFLLGLMAIMASISQVAAEPVNYNLDPSHTFPSFEVDHMGGLSVWRGKFNKSSGNVVYDVTARAGSVKVIIDTTSVDFGFPLMNEHAKTEPDMLDVGKYPTAIYEGKLVKFNGDNPGEVEGTLTLHGVTKPLTLNIKSFMCRINPISKIETCGADAIGHFNREDFGITRDKNLGFKMDVVLRIQVEAKRTPAPAQK